MPLMWSSTLCSSRLCYVCKITNLPAAGLHAKWLSEVTVERRYGLACLLSCTWGNYLKIFCTVDQLKPAPQVQTPKCVHVSQPSHTPSLQCAAHFPHVHSSVPQTNVRAVSLQLFWFKELDGWDSVTTVLFTSLNIHMALIWQDWRNKLIHTRFYFRLSALHLLLGCRWNLNKIHVVLGNFQSEWTISILLCFDWLEHIRSQGGPWDNGGTHASGAQVTDATTLAVMDHHAPWRWFEPLTYAVDRYMMCFLKYWQKWGAQVWFPDRERTFPQKSSQQQKLWSYSSTTSPPSIIWLYNVLDRVERCSDWRI